MTRSFSELATRLVDLGVEPVVMEGKKRNHIPRLEASATASPSNPPPNPPHTINHSRLRCAPPGAVACPLTVHFRVRTAGPMAGHGCVTCESRESVDSQVSDLAVRLPSRE